MTLIPSVESPLATRFVRAAQPILPMFLALTLASAVSVALLAARWVVTGHLTYHYLPWNLFLAWLPLGLALLTIRLRTSQPSRPWRTGLCGLGWLLFFPNAPYLFTDLVHLMRLGGPSPAPFWFDLLLNLTFAVTGLMLGFASLQIMQSLVGRARGRLAGWSFVVAVLGLAGFGVYLGRFLRWNSWDALIAPVPLLADIAACLTAPWQHPRAWGFTFVFSLFLLLAYLLCYGFAWLQNRASETDSAGHGIAATRVTWSASSP
jgi:uncharacterized membrane protein